jgi:hypothetical protein
MDIVSLVSFRLFSLAELSISSQVSFGAANKIEQATLSVKERH